MSASPLPNQLIADFDKSPQAPVLHTSATAFSAAPASSSISASSGSSASSASSSISAKSFPAPTQSGQTPAPNVEPAPQPVKVFATTNNRLRPAAAYLHTENARVLALHGEVELALEHTNLAIQANPNSVDAYVLRAACYLSLRRYNECLSDCARAATISPRFGLTYVVQATAHQLMGKQILVDHDLWKSQQLLNLANPE